MWSQKRAGSACRIFFHIIVTLMRYRLLQALSHVFCISIYCAPSFPSFVQLNHTSTMLRDLARSMVVATSLLCLTRDRWKCFSRIRAYVLFFWYKSCALLEGTMSSKSATILLHRKDMLDLIPQKRYGKHLGDVSGFTLESSCALC